MTKYHLSPEPREKVGRLRHLNLTTYVGDWTDTRVYLVSPLDSNEVFFLFHGKYNEIAVVGPDDSISGLAELHFTPRYQEGEGTLTLRYRGIYNTADGTFCDEVKTL